MIKFKYLNRLTWLAAACFGGFLTAVICACTPRYSVFVDSYESEVEQINTVILIHDATILSAISRHNYLIHQERSIEALDWVNSSITDIVKAKGYKISDKTFRSVGLTFEPKTSVLLFQGESNDVPDAENTIDVKRVDIPTYLDSAGFDNESVSAISKLHWPLSWLKYEEDWEDIVYRDIRKLSLPIDSVLLITQSVGVQVPWGAKVGQFFYSMLDQIGSTEYLAMKNALLPPREPWDSDTSSHLFAVLNYQGDLLWADVFEEIGGNRSEEALENGLEKLFAHLPDHPGKSQ